MNYQTVGKLALAVSLGLAAAQGWSREWTVEEVVAAVVARHPAGEAARLAHLEARARIPLSGRLAPPELEAEFAPNLSGEEGSLRVGLNQALPTGTLRRAQRQAAVADAEAAAADARHAERRLAETTALLAVHLAGLEELLALRQQQAANSSELAATAARAVERGEGSGLDAAHLELEARELHLALDRVDAESRQRRTTLRLLLGLPPEEHLVIRGPLPPAAELLRTSTESTVVAATTRPDLDAARAREQSAARDIDAARASRWDPVTVGVFGEVSRERDEPVGVDTESVVGLRLVVPLPDRRRTGARVSEAAARAQRLSREADSLVLQARADLELAQAEMDAAARREQALSTELLPKARALEERLRAAHAQGQASFADILRARDRRLAFEAAATEARTDFHLARVRHRAAAGLPVESLSPSTPPPRP